MKGRRTPQLGSGILWFGLLLALPWGSFAHSMAETPDKVQTDDTSNEEDSAPAKNPAPEEPPTEPLPASDPPKLTVTDKWSVLVNPAKPRPGIVEFTDKSPIRNVEDFRLLGPMVGHPFGLGEFIVDGRFAGTQGTVQLIEGKNALLSLAVADQFELEGIIQQEKFGGWLMLLGWNQGHGYSVSNVTLKDSGAPWFICEYRGNEAITPTNNEVKQFEWKGAQPFRLTVSDKQLTIGVGKTLVVENYPLENYTAGEVMLGTYDTRYGPRPLQIRSLRIRGIGLKPEKPQKPAKPGTEKGKKKP